MATLKEQLEKLTSLKHRLAVWEALHAHLDDTFVSKDGRGASKAIKAIGCPVERVPEETIEDVLQAIGDGPITELKAEIDEIEGQQVIVLGEVKTQHGHGN